MALLINAELTDDFTNIMKIDKVNEIRNKFAQVLGGFGGLILLAVQIYRTVILNRQVKGNEIADRNREDQAKKDLEEQRRSNISREILDQYVKAVDQLKDENIAVRLGGIYSLEKIMNSPAKEAIEYHDTIIELMCAYVRVKKTFGQNIQLTDNLQPIGIDINAIITIIQRRKNREYENVNIDFSHTYWGYDIIDNIDFSNFDLTECNFEYSSMNNTTFSNTILENASFKCTNLTQSEFIKCQLMSVDFNESILFNVNLRESDIFDCSFRDADMQYFDFENGFIYGIEFNDANLTNSRFNSFIAHSFKNKPLTIKRILAKSQKDIRKAYWTEIREFLDELDKASSIYNIYLDKDLLSIVKDEYPHLLIKISNDEKICPF